LAELLRYTVTQAFQAGRSVVREAAKLHIPPDPVHRVQFGGIMRKRFYHDPRVLLEVSLDRARGVDQDVIP
jgi:hypothetical protein